MTVLYDRKISGGEEPAEEIQSVLLFLKWYSYVVK